MKKTKILLVDDDPDFGAATRSVLEQAGYDVFLTPTGKEGLEHARKDRPAVIVLDVMLPDINGFSVCRELKDDPDCVSIPIILLTSVSAQPGGYTENIAKEHKADMYISKPVDSSKLLDAIRRLLAKSGSQEKEKRQKARILVVDDDPDLLESAKQVLVAHGYEVLTAKDGEEGLAKARFESPDLILLDVIMPGKDGYTVCYELRKSAQTRPIPIIMLTAIGQQLSRPEYGMDIAIDHLADDYISKPFDTQTFLKKIEKHLTFYGG